MSKRVHPSRPDSLVRLHVAEPAPLGLFGLAMGCFVLMFVDFNVTSGKLMLVPWLFLLPATLQLIAGIFDFMRHNIFGGTAFIGYSMVWYGLAAVYFLEISYASHEDADVLIPAGVLPLRQHTGIIFAGYLLFSIVLTIVALGVNRILLSILLSIDYTFLTLIIHTFVPDACPSWIMGIGLALVFVTSMYGFLAILLLKVASGEVFPIGRPFFDWSRFIIRDPEKESSDANGHNVGSDAEMDAVSTPRTKKKDDTYYTSVEFTDKSM